VIHVTKNEKAPFGDWVDNLDVARSCKVRSDLA
jgi:hypothetical protein